MSETAAPSSETITVDTEAPALPDLSGWKLWLFATRFPFLSATLVPVMVGATAAWWFTGGQDGGAWHWGYFGLTLIGVAFMHLGTNMHNDYFDFVQGTDRINENRTPLSGGSPWIVAGKLEAKDVNRAAWLCWSGAIVIGLYLTYQLGYEILIFGLIGFMGGYFYTAPPLKLAHHAVGELFIWLCFGPLVTAGAYFVIAGELNALAFMVGLVPGFLTANIVYIAQFPDHEADKQAGKHHLVVRLGKERAVPGYMALAAAAYVTILVGVALHLAGFEMFPATVLVALLTLPLQLAAIKVLKAQFDRVQELIPGIGMTIQINLFTGLLFFVGLLAAGLMGLE